MKPKICLSIPEIKEFSLEKYPDFDGYEIRSGTHGMRFNIRILQKLKEMFEGKDISLHTQLSRTFSCNTQGFQEFNDPELEVFKAEIVCAKIIGAKKLIFHLTNEHLSEEEKQKLREIIDLAKSKDIKLIYESNTDTSSKVVLENLENFPELDYCLDFGHINTCLKKDALDLELFEFLEKIKPRIAQIHAHNNDGDKDDHNSLDEGTFPWKKALEFVIDAPKLERIVLENKSFENALKSKELIDEFFFNS